MSFGQLPLSGLRVLDLTTIIFGPYTTQMLGDFGAEVIKVEAPGGDATRNIGAGRNPDMAALFLGANRNKKSIVLDLKRAAAKDALWRLIEGADLFVHNIRPQKIAALGFGPDAVLARNAGLVYGGLHGYREDGPYGGRPAYDDVIQGQSGLAGAFIERDGEPVLVPSIVADKSAALMASTGLMAALVQRLRTGKGAYLEVAMFEGMVGYTLLEHQQGTIFSPPVGDIGYARLLTPERSPYRTADGHICMLAYTDAQYRRFWALAGRPELAEDPRFVTHSARADHFTELYRTVGECLTARRSADWLELLQEAEIPSGPVNRLADLRQDPHLEATGFFRAVEHPTEGRLELPDTGFRLDRRSLPVRDPPPGLGQHGRSILGEAGYSEPEIDEILGLEPEGR